VNPKLSISCGFFYLVGNLYPIITGWIPLSKVFDSSYSGSASNTSGDKKPRTLAWWAVPLISWCVLAFSTLWFLGFIDVAKYKSQTSKSKFVYSCEPDFGPAEDPEYHSDSDLPAGESAARSLYGGLGLCHKLSTQGGKVMRQSNCSTTGLR